jgi:hypothetical protein
MRRKFKTALSLLLCAIMVFGTVAIGGSDLLSFTASADESVTYNFDDTTKTLTISGNGKIPDRLQESDTKDTSGNEIKNYKNTIKNVVIEDGITKVGLCAFYGVWSIESVTVSGTVTYINWGAFQNCTGLKTVTINEGVDEICQKSFYGCTSLTTVNLPDSVTTIGDNVFNGCTSLTSVTIPKGVTSLDTSAFDACTSLKEINVDPDNKNYSSVDGVLFDKNTTELITYPLGKTDTTYIFPSTVTTISSKSFAGCTSLTSIEIPDGVTSIESGAFSGCTNLTDIAIGKDVTYIGTDAFKNTGYSKDSNNWADKVLYIGDYLIAADTSIADSYEIKGNTKLIANSAFNNCTSLTGVTIPNSVEVIGYNAFQKCSKLTSVEIPSSVKKICDNAFESCSGLTSVKINEGVTYIGDFAFSGCTSLTSIEIPNSVTEMGLRAFNECTGIKSVTLGNGLKSINNSVFDDCTEVEKLAVGSGTTYINVSDLLDLKNLKEITVSSENNVYSATDDGILLNKSGTKLVLYPLGKEATSYTIPSNVEEIGYQAFYGNTILTSIEIPEGVTSIDEYVFCGCTGLTSVVIPNSVTSIDDYAFEDCTNLKDVTIGSGVTDLGKDVFKNTAYYNNNTDGIFYVGTWLVETKSDISGDITIKEGTTKINDSAFSGRTGITSVTIPDSVEIIGKSAFSGCTSLTSVDMGDGVKSIGESAFYNCSQLTAVIIPTGVTAIESYTFADCIALTSVIIPEGITKIGYNAFSYCENLIIAEIPSTVTQIGMNAFYGSSIKKATIPAGATSIGKSAFDGCANLKEINVAKENTAYSSADGVLFNKDATELITYPAGKTDTSYTVPSTVKTIATVSFCSCGNIQSIVIPDSVEVIGYRAFDGCTNLENITIGSGVSSIKTDAFNRTKYYTESSNWDNDILYIGEYLIASQSSISGDIEIKDTTRVIADSAFSGHDSITSVKIPASVTNIGTSAFSGCKGLKEIKVDEANTAYASTDGVLFNKDATELITFPAGKEGGYTIPSTVEKIDNNAFFYSEGLTSVIIPDSVTAIGEAAFYNCSKLSSITLGNNITSIGTRAFMGTAYFEDDSHWEDSLVLYIDNYLIAVEPEVAGNYTIKEGTKAITEFAFIDCYTLTSITIPNSVSTIGDYAFLTCASLKSITIPSSVKNIGTKAIGYNVDSSSFGDSEYYEVYASVMSGEITYREGMLKIFENRYYVNENLVVNCEKDSAAHQYALENGIKFSLQDDTDKTHAHSCTKNIVAPTCTEEGYTEYTCSCGYSYKTDLVSATGHKYSSPKFVWADDNTATVTFTCEKDSTHTLAKDCTVTKEVLTPATCTEKGEMVYTAKYTFDGIEYSDKKKEPIDVIPHTVGIATCTEPAICKVCGAVCGDVDLTNHTGGTELRNAKDATCTEEGYTGDTYCLDCKNQISSGSVTAALNHNYVNYTYNNDATTSKDGTETGICSRCSAKDTRTKAGTMIKPVINVASTTVDYRSKVTIKAKASGIDSSYKLAIYVGNNRVAIGSNTEVTYNAGETKGDINYTVKVVDANNTIAKDASGNEISKGGKVSCNSGFFKKLVAFFKGLFNKLPSVTVAP